MNVLRDKRYTQKTQGIIHSNLRQNNTGHFKKESEKNL